jgi:nitroreductase
MYFNPAELIAAVDAVIRSRKTVRAFRPEQVPRSQLVEVLEMACTAPSTFNTQPWRVHVLVGKAKQRLSEAILQAHTANAHPPHSALPNPAPPNRVTRQADFGQRYFTTLGVDRTDVAARSRQTGRNFVFFDAPVGLIFTIDATLTKHSWLDYGLFMQNLILAAQARGLATCPQVSFVRYQLVIAEQLELAPEDSVVCGMSLGYADEQAPLNRMEMPRDPLDTFACWRGFDE